MGQEINHLHEAIRSALTSFVEEARSLQAGGRVSPAGLSALVERHRFLRAVCMFHSASENEVVFPVVRCDGLTDRSLDEHALRGLDGLMERFLDKQVQGC
jgi:hypothetical protein